MRQMKACGVAVVLVVVGYIFVAGSMPVSAQGGGSPMPAGVHAMKMQDGSMMLMDGKMMTLYTFAKDTAGVSNCNDNCAKNWPPLAAAADAKPTGDWTIVTRADGTKQWAHKGMPLYTWIKDAKPGDMTGVGVGNGAWKAAAP